MVEACRNVQSEGGGLGLPWGCGVWPTHMVCSATRQQICHCKVGMIRSLQAWAYGLASQVSSHHLQPPTLAFLLSLPKRSLSSGTPSSALPSSASSLHLRRSRGSAQAVLCRAQLYLLRSAQVHLLCSAMLMAQTARVWHRPHSMLHQHHAAVAHTHACTYEVSQPPPHRLPLPGPPASRAPSPPTCPPQWPPLCGHTCPGRCGCGSLPPAQRR